MTFTWLSVSERWECHTAPSKSRALPLLESSAPLGALSPLFYSAKEDIYEVFFRVDPGSDSGSTKFVCFQEP